MVILSAACTRTVVRVIDPDLDIGSQSRSHLPEQNDQVLRVTVLKGKFSWMQCRRACNRSQSRSAITNAENKEARI